MQINVPMVHDGSYSADITLLFLKSMINNHILEKGHKQVLIVNSWHHSYCEDTQVLPPPSPKTCWVSLDMGIKIKDEREREV